MHTGLIWTAHYFCPISWKSISQGGPGSVVGIATMGWTVWWSNPSGEGGARFSAPVQTSPGAHPASCTMGNGSFPEVKSSQGVTLTPHPLLVPWSWKGRATPLLPLWAVRPVHSLSACTRVTFTFFLPFRRSRSLLFRLTDRQDMTKLELTYSNCFENAPKMGNAECSMQQQ